MPDGRTYRLDQFLGLNQIGDAGLRDQVNQHYWSTFGAAAAVGLISGLSQYLGSAGLGGGDGESHGRHRWRRRRRDVAGRAAGHESVSQPAADDHDSRRAPREGVPDQRPRAAGVHGRRGVESVLKRRTDVSHALCRSPPRCALVAVPARAQFVVIDPANLVQTTLIADRVQQHYAELRAQYLTVLRMAQRPRKSGSVPDSRRLPMTSHDPARWEFGRPWIQALNSGDADGRRVSVDRRCRSCVQRRRPPTLSAAARQMLRAAIRHRSRSRIRSR